MESLEASLRSSNSFDEPHGSAPMDFAQMAAAEANKSSTSVEDKFKEQAVNFQHAATQAAAELDQSNHAFYAQRSSQN